MNKIDLLEPEFKESIQQLLIKVKEMGYVLVPFFTLRNPWVQARLWRQSRTTTQINRAVGMLHNAKALFLSEVLASVGPQYGRWATNALPGQSWHQWREAVDCFVLENGKAVWNPNHTGYATWAKQALLMGLQPGHYWSRRDSAHLQKRYEKVLTRLSWVDVEKEMLLQFGDKENS